MESSHSEFEFQDLVSEKLRISELELYDKNKQGMVDTAAPGAVLWQLQK